MSLKPPYMGSSKTSNNDPRLTTMLAQTPKMEVFYMKEDNTIAGTGMVILNDGSILAPESFGVESGSINFGDLLTISEASGFLAKWDHVNNEQSYLVDYLVPRDAEAGLPRYFHLYEAEHVFPSQSDGSVTLTSNPLTFNYTTQLDARTSALTFTSTAAMTDVRIKIVDIDAGIVLKYLPSKTAWLGNTGGYTFVAGENVVDMGDSPMLLTAGTTLEFEIDADNVSLLGNTSLIPKFSATVQRGKYINLSTEDSVTPEYIKQQLESLASPNKLSKSAIQDAVLSVNGNFGDVVVSPSNIGAQPLNSTLTSISALSNNAQTFYGIDAEGNIVLIPYTAFSASLLRQVDAASVGSILNLGDAANLDTDVPNGVPTLNSEGKLDLSKINVSLATVATTGNYNDLIDLPSIPNAQVQTDWNATTGLGVLLNKPILFSGAYSDLSGKPVLFSGNYSDLIGSPVLSTVAISGNYTDLTNKPTIPSAQVNSDWNSTSGVSQILNKPSLFSGAYADLTGKPSIPSAQIQSDWNQTSITALDYIKNKPSIPTVNYPVTSVNTKTGAVVLTASDVGAIATGASIAYSQLTGAPTLATVATSGSYVDLTNKPTIPSTTSQITEGTNLYYTDTRVGTYLAAQGYKKVETFQGTTNASGQYIITFANTYTVAPNVQPVIIGGTANQFVLISSVSLTGCTITVQQRNSVTLLSVEVLLAATTALSGATVGVLVTPR